MEPTRALPLVAALVLCGAACGGPAGPGAAEPEVDCQYATLPARFCGPGEDETHFRETHREPVRVCNGCLTDEECSERPGGRCVELPGEGCAYSAFVCTYPGDPCHGDRAGCEGSCANRAGRAVCLAPADQP